jgi:hypothetical protein
MVIKHVEGWALPLGHHKGGRGAWSGGPDAADFDWRFSLIMHDEAGVYVSTEPIHRAEVMGLRAHL